MTEVPVRDQVAASRRATGSALHMRLANHPLVKYVLIGGLCFVIDAGLLWFCTSVLGWEIWLGATVGYWTGLLVNFSLNRLVMGRASSNLVRQSMRYGVLLGANFFITLGFLHLAAAWGLDIVVAKTIIVAASTCWNYLLYRRWVFV